MKHYEMKCEAKRITKMQIICKSRETPYGISRLFVCLIKYLTAYSLTGAKMKSSRLPHEPELLVICAPTVIVPSVVVIAAMRG